MSLRRVGYHRAPLHESTSESVDEVMIPMQPNNPSPVLGLGGKPKNLKQFPNHPRLLALPH